MQPLTFLCGRRGCRRPLILWRFDDFLSWLCIKHGEQFVTERPQYVEETCDCCGQTEPIVDYQGQKWRRNSASSDGYQRGSQLIEFLLRDCEFWLCARCEAKRMPASEFAGV